MKMFLKRFLYNVVDLVIMISALAAIVGVIFGACWLIYAAFNVTWFVGIFVLVVVVALLMTIAGYLEGL